MAKIETLDLTGMEQLNFIPDNWRPTITRETVYDDEEESMTQDEHWRPYFAGGATNYPWVMRDQRGIHWIHREFSHVELHLAHLPNRPITCNLLREAIWIATI